MLPSDGRMHFSALKQFAYSPSHYASYISSGIKDTESMRIGRALHALVLQGIEPIVYTGDRRAGKDWDAFLIGNNAKKENILNISESKVVFEMAESVSRNDLASELIAACHTKEKKVEWEMAGIQFAGTPDAYGDGILLDLKSCQSAFPRKFLWDANSRNYHAQLALYDIALGTQYVKGATSWREQYLIAVENVAPYNCVVYRSDDLRIDQGYEKCLEWIARYKACVLSGNFGGYDVEQPVIWDAQIITSEED